MGRFALVEKVGIGGRLAATRLKSARAVYRLTDCIRYDQRLLFVPEARS
jgi:hypothetical protein